MSDEILTENSVSWGCPRCNSSQQVPKGVRFFRCDACGSLFRFQWRGGQIDNQLTRQLLTTYLDSGRDAPALRSLGLKYRQDLQDMNDVIRRLEMAKGGERIRVLAIFLIICALIYTLFRLTVGGTSILSNPGITELAALAVAVFSLLVIAFFRLRKGAIVRKVNKFLGKRDEIDRDLESIEAALALQFNTNLFSEDLGSVAPAYEGTDSVGQGVEDSQTDIIEKFASRKQSTRKRLNIRDDS